MEAEIKTCVSRHEELSSLEDKSPVATILKWSVGVVQNFLTKHGFQDYKPIFLKNEIDGQILSYINLEMLQELTEGPKAENQPLLNQIRSEANREDRERCLIDPETLFKMVVRENEVRRSEETQKRFSAVEMTAESDWMETCLNIQEDIAVEFGFVEPKQAAHVLRTAKQWYPSDSRFKETPLYVKFNRAHDGPVKEGEKIKDVSLNLMDGSSTTLFQIIDSLKMPVAIISGSVS